MVWAIIGFGVIVLILMVGWWQLFIRTIKVMEDSYQRIEESREKASEQYRQNLETFTNALDEAISKSVEAIGIVAYGKSGDMSTPIPQYPETDLYTEPDDNYDWTDNLEFPPHEKAGTLRPGQGIPGITLDEGNTGNVNTPDMFVPIPDMTGENWQP